MLEDVTYGFSIWWVHYLCVWPLLVALTRLLRRDSSRVVWACFFGAYGLAFSAMCSIPYFLTGGFYAGASCWVSGIPFDILRCLGNAALMFFLCKLLSRCLEYIGKSVN